MRKRVPAGRYRHRQLINVNCCRWSQNYEIFLFHVCGRKSLMSYVIYFSLIRYCRGLICRSSEIILTHCSDSSLLECSPPTAEAASRDMIVSGPLVQDGDGLGQAPHYTVHNITHDRFASYDFLRCMWLA
jgi:hypothetical protein